MRYSFLCIVILTAFLCSPAYSQRETRTVSSFNKISFGIAADLYLTQGNTQKLELEGNKDDLDKIETEVVGGQLKIHIKDYHWFNWNMGTVSVYITAPEINEVSLGGSGKITGTNTIKSTDMRVSVSGSGKLQMDLNCDNLKLDVSGSGRMDLSVNTGDIDEDISGSGSINLKGNAANADLEISGSGKLEAADLQVKAYTIHISGSGRGNISVSDAITANISGSGSILYKGNPDKVISKVSGSGKVRKMD